MKARDTLIEAFRLLRHHPSLALPTLAVMMGSLVLFALLVLSALAFGGLSQGGFSPENMGNALAGAAGVMGVLLVLTAVAVVMAHGVTVAMANELMKTGATSLDAGFGLLKNRLVDVTVASAVLALAIGFGTMLLVVPGLIVLLFLMFTFPVMVTEESSSFVGIRGSILAVKANFTQVLVFFAFMCGLGVALWVANALVGQIPLVGPVVSLAVTSAFGGYTAVALLQAYKWLEHEPETPAEVEEESEELEKELDVSKEAGEEPLETVQEESPSAAVAAEESQEDMAEEAGTIRKRDTDETAASDEPSDDTSDADGKQGVVESGKE